MSPKEKAKELVDTFRKFVKPQSSGFWVSNEDTTIKNAKQCALICIDESLNCDSDIVNWESHSKYYNEIKKEIELL